MKRFLAVVALFLAPVILVCGVFGLAVYTSGEWRTEEEVAQMVLDGEPAFLGLAYRDNTRYYKHLVASGKGADLLVLGTSRSMQFHSEFFTTDSFYNAGGGSGYINGEPARGKPARHPHHGDGPVLLQPGLGGHRRHAGGLRLRAL